MKPIAVLAGGPSSEHAVSLQTGANVLELLRADLRAVRPVFVGLDGTWRLGSSAEEFAELAERGPGGAGAAVLAELRQAGETAFVGLHGVFGEDGTVQRMLERAGVAYTGSGPNASEIGMDKELSKVAASKIGARCGAHELLQGTRPSLARIAATIGFPCFVKPVCGGSSVGVTRVDSLQDLPDAVRRAQGADRAGRCLVEERVEGAEVTCGVLRRGGTLVVLPLVQVDVPQGFYDYHAKYLSERTRYACPAPVSDAARSEIESVSRRLYESLDLRGVVRLDFVLRQTDGAPIFLELNTLPGFTSHSLVPMAARAAGWGPLDVVRAVLDDAWVPA